jgi:hypothetical protein
MLKKNKKGVKVFFLLLLFLSVFSENIAQIAINSPYSRFGLGELASRKDAYHFGMGGISTAISSNRHVNPYNPASNFAYDTLSFIFSGGLIASRGTLKTDDLSNRYSFASLGYLTFGFPVSHKFKASIGILPYSNVGYNIVSNDTIANVGNAEYIYQGSGGINNFYGSLSFELFKNFSIGAKMTYMFGKADLIRSVFFPDSVGYLNTRIDNYMQVGDLYFEYGLQYHHKINEKYTIGFGLLYAPQQNIKANENYLVRSYFPTGLGVESYRDTLASRLDNPGYLRLPVKTGFGIMLKRTDQWLVGADITWQEWSNFQAFNRNDSLRNTLQINLGGEFTPSRSITGNYWKRVKYRLGFRFNETYLSLEDKQINEFGISFGVGLPIPRSLSTINAAIEIGQLGTTAAGLIQNNYIRLTIGVAVWERWFVKNKYF